MTSAVPSTYSEQPVNSEWLQAAKTAYQNSYQPYFTQNQLGIALVSNAGKVICGAEYQNAAYPSSISAMRSALASFMAGGERQIRAVVIYGEHPKFTGVMSDLLSEVGGQIDIYLCSNSGSEELQKINFGEYSLDKALFPTHRDDILNSAELKILRQPTLSDTASLNFGIKLHRIFSLFRPGLGDSITERQFLECCHAAARASASAYAPISHYPVGCGTLLKDGTVVAGSNMEHQNLELGLCAERTAFVTAASAGKFQPNTTSFEEQLGLVVTYVPQLLPAEPCGGCRQVMTEPGADYPVLSICKGPKATFAAKFLSGQLKSIEQLPDGSITMTDLAPGGLLPAAFGRKNLFAS